VREYEPGEWYQEVPQAFTVSEVCRRLKKSRRQVYRYLQKGWLEPAGKFLNEWLVTAASLQRLEPLLPATRRRVPSSVAVLVPEYRIQGLDAVRHAHPIAEGILNRGTRWEARWFLSAYPAAWIKNFLIQDGRRLLSQRSLHFWCHYLHVPVPPPTWREYGRRIGLEGGR